MNAKGIMEYKGGGETGWIAFDYSMRFVRFYGGIWGDDEPITPIRQKKRQITGKKRETGRIACIGYIVN